MYCTLEGGSMQGQGGDALTTLHWPTRRNGWMDKCDEITTRRNGWMWLSMSDGWSLEHHADSSAIPTLVVRECLSLEEIRIRSAQFGGGLAELGSFGYLFLCWGGQIEETAIMSWRGKLSQVVQELRIHCCQYSPASTVTRYYSHSCSPGVSLNSQHVLRSFVRSDHSSIARVVESLVPFTFLNSNLGFSFLGFLFLGFWEQWLCVDRGFWAFNGAFIFIFKNFCSFFWEILWIENVML